LKIYSTRLLLVTGDTSVRRCEKFCLHAQNHLKRFDEVKPEPRLKPSLTREIWPRLTTLGCSQNSTGSNQCSP